MFATIPETSVVSSNPKSTYQPSSTFRKDPLPITRNNFETDSMASISRTGDRDKYSIHASNPDRLPSRKPGGTGLGEYNFERLAGGENRAGGEYEFSSNYISGKKQGSADAKEGSINSRVESQPRSREQIYPIQFK